jgi:hypothetical protein
MLRLEGERPEHDHPRGPAHGPPLRPVGAGRVGLERAVVKAYVPDAQPVGADGDEQEVGEDGVLEVERHAALCQDLPPPAPARRRPRLNRGPLGPQGRRRRGPVAGHPGGML